MIGHDVIAAAAERLGKASTQRQACAPVRDLLGETDIDAAYAVQMLLNDVRITNGARVVGRKIGLTAPAVQKQFGVARPDFGVLFDDMVVGDGDAIDMGRLIQPRVEGEIAFVLGAGLDNPSASVVDVLRATEFLLPAIEVVDSRVAAWDIKITDTIADNASSGMVVLGTTPISPRGLDLTEVALSLEHLGQPVSTGIGAACLNSPVSAVAWLAREVSRREQPLRAGDIVMSGALGPLVGVDAPGRYRADFSGLGHVEAVFENHEGAA